MRLALIAVMLIAGISSVAAQDAGTEYWPTFFGLRLKITDSLVIAFTMVLAVFTGLLWWSTDKLWRVSQLQSDLTKKALVAGQRAWISVSLRADSDFNVTEGYADIGVSLEVTNIGRSPAIRAHTMMKMVEQSEDIPRILAELCVEERKQPNHLNSRIVLPGESYDRGWGPHLSRDDFDLVSFWPHIIGCVSYEVVGDDEIHQTAFVYGIALNGDGEFNGFISTKPGVVPKERLLIEVQSGGFAT